MVFRGEVPVVVVVEVVVVAMDVGEAVGVAARALRGEGEALGVVAVAPVL